MAEPEARRNRRSRPHYRSAPHDAVEPSQEAAATPSAEVQRGVVKWFNRGKGYGFIHCQDGSEVFIHESAVILGSSDLPLGKGREVEFELRQGPRGRQAYSAVVIGDAAEGAVEEGESSEEAEAEPTPQREHTPHEPQQPVFDFSRKVPASWQRKPNAFVYTYTIYGRRGG